jgi:hypothetical protein
MRSFDILLPPKIAKIDKGRKSPPHRRAFCIATKGAAHYSQVPVEIVI